MGIHDQVDWRNLENSLALDVRLVESVFYGLSKEYEKRQREREKRLHPDSSNNEDHSRRNNHRLDEEMFAKADVLVALENAKGYLEKRPWLRVLHTRLACVSLEKEGAGLQGFVRYRQRDRNVCLGDVRRRLEAIYADAKTSMEVEEKHKSFLAQARAVSPWCVRESKYLHLSPARQLYGVHVLPPRRVTEEELQAQRDCVAGHARAVVNAAVGVVMDKMLAPYRGRPRTSKSTGRRTARRQALDSAKASSSQRQAKAKHQQVEREGQLRALRLELLAPTAELTLKATNGEGEIPKMKTKDEIARVMMQLATVEAQGDTRLAHKLLDCSIVQSGFRRAAEQAKRLGITDQPWENVKLWRELYRTSTMQVLETALHG